MRLSLFFPCFFLLLCVSCRQQAGFSTRIVYQHRDFGPEKFSLQNVVVLGLLPSQEGDSSWSLQPAILAGWLKELREDLRPLSPEKFQKTYLANHDTASLDSFYRNLAKGRVVALQTSDSIWQAMPARYLMAAYLRNALAIRRFDKSLKRTLKLEVEIWDCDSTEVVWRTEVSGVTLDTTLSDRQFIKGALAAAAAKLPHSGPVTNEKEW